MSGEMPDALPVEISFPAPQAARVIVCTLASETVTYLEHLSSTLRVDMTLNAPWEITFSVPSDNPEVNLPYNSSRFVREGQRLVYFFLRYGYTLAATENAFMDASAGPWQCVAAGLIMEIEDEATTETPTSIVHAWDPWKYLYRLPALTETCVLPGEDPVVDPQNATMQMSAIYHRGGATVKEILRRAVECDSKALDLIDYGQTAYYGGTIETTPILDQFEIQHGASVGEVWDNVVKTGTCDIVVKPIWDPARRPGMIAELSVYNKIGSLHPEAVFSWDRWPHSNVSISRRVDGNERANWVQMYSGPGSLAVPAATDTDSRDNFGTYFEQQAFPGQARASVIQMLAQRELKMRKDGQTSYAVTPAVERAPIPLKEYHLGDTVPVMTSRRLRRPENLNLRVMSIPLVVGVDEIPHVEELLVGVDAPQITTPVEP
jgi:hypothetical protein